MTVIIAGVNVPNEAQTDIQLAKHTGHTILWHRPAEVNPAMCANCHGWGRIIYGSILQGETSENRASWWYHDKFVWVKTMIYVCPDCHGSGYGGYIAAAQREFEYADATA